MAVDDKNKYGQYFTPKVVADFMVKLLELEKGKRILEPSCGDGVFLSALSDANYKNIEGIEFDSTCSLNTKFKIKYADYLQDETTTNGYDGVIGNPPYIRWKNLDPVLKNNLDSSSVWKEYCNSLCDYSVAFIAKAILDLKANGTLVFITPEYWLYTYHSQKLRNLIIENGTIDRIYHAAAPEPPPALTVISSTEPATFSTKSSALSTESWYLVHTKPRQEDVALTNLQRQGYECYLPQMRIERIRRRKAEIATEPMFPRYLFIHLDSGDQGKSWSPIRSTLGVSQLVHFGARAAKVDDTLVDLLRQREQAMPLDPMFHSGDSVFITDGPFSGIEAIYQTADAERRAFILLEILSKPVSMQIDTGRLRKAG
jgi:transcriptional antiterminator RfaH